MCRYIKRIAILMALMLLVPGHVLASAGVIVRAHSRVYLHSSGKTTARVLAKRASARLTSLHRGWAVVRIGKRKATVSAQRLIVKKPFRGYVLKKTALYKSPSASSPRKGSLPRGTALWIDRVTGGFLRVRDRAGHRGYVKASAVSTRRASLQTPAKRKISRVLKIARRQLGAPYSKRDCSQFTAYCFRQVGIHISSSVKYQGYSSGYRRVRLNRLRAGDIVVFNTVDDSDLSDHVGIYLGKGSFIHSSSAAGKVIISSLSSGYYKRNFSWGLRIIK